MLYPLLTWCSAAIRDLAWCAEVNKYLFFIDREIAKHLLFSGLTDKNTYIKYPKAAKEQKDKSYDLKKKLVMKYYKWSDQEFERNFQVLDFIDWSHVATSLGCETKERKLLGLKDSAKKSAPCACKKSVTLFDF